MQTKLEEFEVRTAEILTISLRDVEDVVAHQFKTANKAFSTNSSVEISGLAKISVRPKKVATKLATLTKIYEAYLKKLPTLEDSDAKKLSLQKRIEGIIEDINFLKNKS